MKHPPADRAGAALVEEGDPRLGGQSGCPVRGRAPAPARSSGSWRGPAAWRWRPRVADRGPARRLRREQDLDGLVDLRRRRREGLDDRLDLVWVDAPHPRAEAEARARSAAARGGRAGGTPSRRSATASGVGMARGGDLGSLARTISGCSNWPVAVIADCGIAPRCAETKSIRPNDSDSTRGCAAIAVTSASAPCVSISTCSGIWRRSPRTRDWWSIRAGRLHVREALRLGQHHVAKRRRRDAPGSRPRRRRRRCAPGAADAPTRPCAFSGEATSSATRWACSASPPIGAPSRSRA